MRYMLLPLVLVVAGLPWSRQPSLTLAIPLAAAAVLCAFGLLRPSLPAARSGVVLAVSSYAWVLWSAAPAVSLPDGFTFGCSALAILAAAGRGWSDHAVLDLTARLYIARYWLTRGTLAGLCVLLLNSLGAGLDQQWLTPAVRPVLTAAGVLLIFAGVLVRWITSGTVHD